MLDKPEVPLLLSGDINSYLNPTEDKHPATPVDPYHKGHFLGTPSIDSLITSIHYILRSISNQFVISPTTRSQAQH